MIFKVSHVFTMIACLVLGSDAARVGQGSRASSNWLGLEGTIRELRRAAPVPSTGLAGVKICFVTEGLAGPGKYGGIAHAVERQAYLYAQHDARVDIAYTGVFRSGNASKWKSTYARRGLNFFDVPRRKVPRARESDEIQRAYDVWLWFIENDALEVYDIIVLHDMLGRGLFLLQAKRSGLGFRHTVMMVHAHGSTRLSHYYNAQLPVNQRATMLAYGMERLSVELADVVLSPSEYYFSWMENVAGYRLDKKRQKLWTVALLPPHDSLFERSRELVGNVIRPRGFAFYGRMDKLKGLVTMLDALDLLQLAIKQGKVRPVPEVYFLGDSAAINFNGRYMDAIEYVQNRRKKGEWTFPIFVYTNMSSAQVARMLLDKQAVFVNPTNGEASSTVTVEMAHAGVPMITTSVCGIPELVGDKALMMYWSFSRRDASRLAVLMARALKSGIDINIPRVSARRTRDLYISAIHTAVSAQRSARQALSSCVDLARFSSRSKTGPYLSVVIVNENGALALENALSYLLGQRLLPALTEILVLVPARSGEDVSGTSTVIDKFRHAFKMRKVGDITISGIDDWRNVTPLTGSYVIVLRDTSVPQPTLIEFLVRAACSTVGADVVIGFESAHDGSDITTYLGSIIAENALFVDDSKDTGPAAMMRNELWREGSWRRVALGDNVFVSQYYDRLLTAQLTNRQVVMVPVPLVIKPSMPWSGRHRKIDANIGNRVVGFCQVHRIEPNACAGLSFGVQKLIGP